MINTVLISTTSIIVISTNYKSRVYTGIIEFVKFLKECNIPICGSPLLGEHRMRDQRLLVGNLVLIIN